jgi:small subunit ribosomal protein S17
MPDENAEQNEEPQAEDTEAEATDASSPAESADEPVAEAADEAEPEAPAQAEQAAEREPAEGAEAAVEDALEATAEPEDALEATAEPEDAVEATAEPEVEEPAQEAPAEDETADQPVAAQGDEAAAGASSGAKRKKKRLPRSLRPQKTRRSRVPSAERKPIVRLPKPEHVRGRRQERQGTVVSAGADKTIVVRVDTVKLHPTYKKVIRRSSRLHAHDEANEAKVGDVVRIVETRPLSKLKRWRLQEVVEAAK